MGEVKSSRIIGANSAYGRNASDFYPTPPEVTQALVDFLGLRPETMIWEPAAGEGHMARVLAGNGYIVTATDIKTGVDFMTSEIETPWEWIMTNPPFSLAEGFIQRCAGYKKPFALLLKVHFWNAKRRLTLFRSCPPAYVLPLTWRPVFLPEERGKSPLMDFMWCVWDEEARHRNNGATVYLPLSKPERVFEGVPNG